MAIGAPRIGPLFAVFAVLLALAGARAAQLGIVKSGGLKERAASQQVSQVVVPARRGTITDRRGVELAVSEPADNVAVSAYLVPNPLDAAKRLAPLLGVQQNDLLRILSNRRNTYAYLARNVPADRAAIVAKLKIPGIQFEATSRRSYPRSFLASQVLGTVGTEGRGLSGLEYADDHWLQGANGKRVLTRDAIGQPIGVKDDTPARAGHHLKLTIDAAIQSKTEAVLSGIGQVYRPKAASAIVMDPRSGEVLAMANWPRVNANDMKASPSYAQLNRATSYTYEPGSTFKAVTISGALEDHLVTPSTSFNLGSQIQVADRTIHNAEGEGGGTLTTSQILAQSNNVGTITIGQRLGARRFDGWVRKFGFGKPTGVDLPGEERGLVLPTSKYSGSSMGNLPIGQGELVTPMQIATAYAAIANGGILRPGRIVDAVDGRATRKPRGHRIISASTAAQVRKMLEGVLAPGGTASEVSVPGYQLAGKTGTANKVVDGEYSKTKYIASFVGFAPASNPRLLTAVMVDEPQGAIYGGAVAAPAFGQIMGYALPYLRIPPK